MIMNYIVVRLVINQRKIGILHTSCYSVLKIERLFNQTPTISIHLGQIVLQYSSYPLVHCLNGISHNIKYYSNNQLQFY